jgi:hypothetical protein
MSPNMRNSGLPVAVSRHTNGNLPSNRRLSRRAARTQQAIEIPRWTMMAELCNALSTGVIIVIEGRGWGAAPKLACMGNVAMVTRVRITVHIDFIHKQLVVAIG